MLRTFLSPLSARFTSPTTPRQENGFGSGSGNGNGGGNGEEEGSSITPEDFARDVLIEVMRKSVERLKFAEGLNARTEVCLYLGLEDPILA